MAESEEELKNLLIRVKEESEKADLKLSSVKKEAHDIQFHYFMANRWGKVETVTDFLFLGSEVTADNDCTHEIKRCLLLGNKTRKNLDSV